MSIGRVANRQNTTFGWSVTREPFAERAALANIGDVANREPSMLSVAKPSVITLLDRFEFARRKVYLYPSVYHREQRIDGSNTLGNPCTVDLRILPMDWIVATGHL